MKRQQKNHETLNHGNIVLSIEIINLKQQLNAMNPKDTTCQWRNRDIPRVLEDLRSQRQDQYSDEIVVGISPIGKSCVSHCEFNV